jgi:hypothetical protein
VFAMRLKRIASALHPSVADSLRCFCCAVLGLCRASTCCWRWPRTRASERVRRSAMLRMLARSAEARADAMRLPRLRMRVMADTHVSARARRPVPRPVARAQRAAGGGDGREGAQARHRPGTHARMPHAPACTRRAARI